MENRFGFKDLIFCLLLVCLIVLVLLAMQQFDRQYQVVRNIQSQSESQLRELVAIHTDLQHGVSFSSTTGPSSGGAGEGADPFPEIRQLRGEGKYNQGDWLVQNLYAPVGKITPLLSTDVYAQLLQGRVQETLAYQNPETLEYLPLLATSWTTTENLAAWQKYVDQRKTVPITEGEVAREPACPPAEKPDDRRQYIAKRLKEGRRPEDIGAEADCPPPVTMNFKLRHGVTFSDGAPFSADDVVFTYDWIENPKVDAPRQRESIERVKSVEKVNDYEVTVKFKEPYYQSFDAIAASMGIMSKKFYSAYSPEEYNKSVGLLIGTGSYRLQDPTSWRPDATKPIVLYRNERYWGIAPSFDRLVFYQVEGDQASLVLYGNGDLDVLSLTPQQYDLLLKNPDQKKDIVDRSKTLIYMSPLSGYYFIGWNQKRPLFADKRVRQALTMLTNRQGICDTIYLGYAAPAPGPFHPLSPQHDANLVDWKYDPAKAKAIFKELGFEDRGKGVLEKADGTRFSFKITYPSKNETVDRVMQYIKDNLASAGVDAQLDPVDWTIIDHREKGREFDAIVMGWAGGSLEDDIYQMFDSSQILDQGDNFVSYSNPEFDKALHEARRTLDHDKRVELWHECERILHEDQPYTFLTVNKYIRLFDPRIQNVHQTKAGLNIVWDWWMPLPWYVPPGMQKYKQQ